MLFMLFFDPDTVSIFSFTLASSALLVCTAQREKNSNTIKKLTIFFILILILSVKI